MIIDCLEEQVARMEQERDEARAEVERLRDALDRARELETRLRRALHAASGVMYQAHQSLGDGVDDCEIALGLRPPR